MDLLRSKQQIWKFLRDRQVMAEQVEKIAPRLEPFIRIARGEPYALKQAHEIDEQNLIEAIAQATEQSVNQLIYVSLTIPSSVEGERIILPWNEETRQNFGTTLRDRIRERFRVRHEDISALQGELQMLQENIDHPEHLRIIIWQNIAATLYAYLGSHLKREHRRAAELQGLVSHLPTSPPLARSRTDEKHYYVLAA